MDPGFEMPGDSIGEEASPRKPPQVNQQCWGEDSDPTDATTLLRGKGRHSLSDRYGSLATEYFHVCSKVIA